MGQFAINIITTVLLLLLLLLLLLSYYCYGTTPLLIVNIYIFSCISGLTFVKKVTQFTQMTIFRCCGGFLSQTSDVLLRIAGY